MDISLNKFLLRSKEIENNFKNGNISKELIKEHYNMLKYINECSKKLENVHRNIEDTYNKISSKFLKSDDESQKFFKNVTYTELSSINEILNGKLYWIKDLKQYCIKINGKILYGDIGNIYTKHMNNKNMINIYRCKNHNRCKNILKQKVCKFYHDPIKLKELVDMNYITTKFYNKQISFPRNFINTSWLYDSYNNNNYMRNIGSRSKILNDIEYLKLTKSPQIINKLEDYKNQTFHDLLIILLLEENNLFIEE